MSVLVIEDEIELASAMSEVLQMEGLESLTVSSFEKAKGILSTKKFEFYIIDIILNGNLVGWDFVPMILAKNPDAKIIVSSGNIEEEDLLRPGIWAFCQKPYDISQLVRRISQEKRVGLCSDMNPSEAI